MVISAALAPEASASAPILAAKKYVLPAVSMYPTNHPFTFESSILPVPVFP